MEKNIKSQILALGDEAVSFAAIDSGVKGIYGYPGTPSTEVFEGAARAIKKLDDGRVAEWAANEKVAYELALGTSYSGHRTIVTMKHVGLNVAMDAFVNSAMTGVRGGLLVIVADDPGMHSSQNEQDSRYLADFAHITCLEPSTPQEAYDLTCKAFEISERQQLPVMIRLVTRLAHSRGMIDRVELKAPICIGKPPADEMKNWILVPALARIQYKKLRGKLGEMESLTEELNTITDKGTKIGLITAGMGKAYMDQLCKEDDSVNKYTRFDIRSYPVTTKMLKSMLDKCEKLYVFEENFPYIEDKLVALSRGTEIHGRRDETLSIDGELTPAKLRTALGVAHPEQLDRVSMELPIRPPRLCDGCGHTDAFKALNEAFKRMGIEDPRVFGDIGCYALAVQPPLNAIHACVEMGASLGMALGAAYGGMTPSVGVLGDSTFFHSGLPTMISMAQTKVNANIMVLDNRSTAMTGQQKTIALDSIPDVAKGAGFKEKNIHILIPLPNKHEENVEKLVEILSHDGPDFIIFKRECIEALRKGINKK